ncbi:hypothetical protein MIMGU_mgv1a008934mg [Erythranthe guttata]|uniref:TCP domain-containing protein n=1 Tax=Erythranthe guttata TaxID=4155 RepID=A0A022RU18_ERYGU|nr:hypothetical protein MIMGU_mgv1a008934mg [Erythranthe guttata]
MDELNPDEEEGANKRRAPNDAVDLYGGVDRRVRLSVNTAIQFYDLQDRLGLDQPSKAVEWLLKAAAASITDLPPMSNPFPESPKQQLSDEKIKLSSAAGSDLLAFDSGEVDMDGGEISYLRQQMPTKSSACSNNSETSKGSGLSLSRSENWIKADNKKEKEGESSHVASFTELLSGGINSFNNAHNGGSFRQNPNRRGGGGGGDAIQSSDYFKTGLLGQLQFANSPKSVAAGSNHHHHHHNHNAEFQNFAFPAAGGNGGSSEYNLNFTISSANNSPGFTAFNRGTLQSNSPPPSLLSHDIQRFNNPPADDGSTPNFFISGGGAAAPVQNHNHFLSGFDAGLHLYYGDAHSNKGKLEKK